MSFLNLKRLLAPKRVWKVFKTKLPLKLHKLNRSKATKKPFHRTSRKLGWPSLSIQHKKFKIKPNPRPLIHHRNNHYYLQKNPSPSPVFVDQLFIETVSTAKEHVHPASETVEAVTKKEKSCLSTTLKQSGSFDKTSSLPGSSTEDRTEFDDKNMVTADDMWESLVLASPQMHEINERAEEFIARFRADMQNQETLARRL
ncbi:UNVERIFIED_CONTAM: hypothetical protein Slati_0738000 [Sesamum latifolium]|uniref:Cotton fiber protein n=1 Tax=Sesamum latifolium TaxID=2727402 RepID=A0AAW2Y606_9LAMI